MDIIELEYQSEHESSGRISETVNPGNVICPVGDNPSCQYIHNHSRPFGLSVDENTLERPDTRNGNYYAGHPSPYRVN
jgi:hypothetical protein